MNQQFGVTRIATLLHDRCRLSSRRFAGDYVASDILIDLDRAIQQAQLTERQVRVIELVYVMDMTQEATAKAMQVSQAAVNKTLNGACKRIAAVYQSWDYNDYSKLTGGGRSKDAVDQWKGA